MDELEHILDALRLRIGAGAREVLRQAHAHRGKLDLVHRSTGAAAGSVEWAPAGSAANARLTPWAATEFGILYVAAADVPTLHGGRIILDAEMSWMPGDCDIRLVTELRTYSESEQAVLDYVILRRSMVCAAKLLSRIAATRGI